MPRRTFEEALVDVADAVLAAAAAPTIRPTRIDCRLPMEFSLERRSGSAAPCLLADIPSWRWRTVFDRPLSRLDLGWLVESDA
jgi:hypothetical protein